MKNFNKISAITLGLVLAFSACKTNDDETTKVVLKDNSVTPAFVKKLYGFENLEVYSLIGSDDNLVP